MPLRIGVEAFIGSDVVITPSLAGGTFPLLSIKAPDSASQRVSLFITDITTIDKLIDGLMQLRTMTVAADGDTEPAHIVDAMEAIPPIEPVE